MFSVLGYSYMEDSTKIVYYKIMSPFLSEIGTNLKIHISSFIHYQFIKQISKMYTPFIKFTDGNEAFATLRAGGWVAGVV